MIVSFSLLTERSFVAIFNIAFDQSIQGEPERASKCYDALVKAMQGAGFYPYRVGLQGMEKLWSGDPEYWDVLNDIKRALDPEDIVARGRYIPPLEKEWIILAAASGSPSAPATPRGDSTRNRYSISP
ncbi:MAG: FAD-linked oxidase C-terminal domain-containing protein, partial [Candidatus Hydrogenedentes bacterium]|jgi:4-cresol dehydrogenase (hydroxylating)|nr:FAD-linked oxidase C-terminal domain-containing protein [Candidatus Hydrogenedentota bacterium]